MVKQVKARWEATTPLERVLATALTALVLGGGVSVAAEQPAPADLTDQVRNNTQTIARHGAQIDSLRSDQKEDRSVLDFLSCGQENRINGVSEVPCLRYLTGRAQ